MKTFFKYSNEQIKYLCKKDKTLACYIDKIGHIKREVSEDLFSSLIKSIISQQISTTAAKSIYTKLENKINKINEKNILALSDEELKSVGISYKKVEYIKNIALKVSSGELDLRRLQTLSDEQICEELVKLKGIGLWSAQMLMIFSMQRQNILSFGDLGIQRGLKMMYKHKQITPKLFEKYQKRFSPYNSLASLYIWEIASGKFENFKSAFYNTKFGKIKISYTKDAITYVGFCQKADTISQKSELSDKAYTQLKEYFDGKRKTFDLPLKLSGSEFYLKVWEALKSIPYGQTATYKDIAKLINNEKASRAVGLANNKNPISIIIPCHRVIGSNGKLVGYASGVENKQKLLELEKTYK